MTFSQLYLNECSPAKYRGLVLSAFMFWTSIGTLVGTIVDNFTAPIMGKNSYLIPLGLIYIVPAIVGFGVLLVSRLTARRAQSLLTAFSRSQRVQDGCFPVVKLSRRGRLSFGCGLIQTLLNPSLKAFKHRLMRKRILPRASPGLISSQIRLIVDVHCYQ